MKQGHDDEYYQTLDPRFLGEDRFVREVARRTEAKEIEIEGKRASFARLLEAICALRKVNSKALLQAGRQRQWVRSLLLHCL